jgi:hypothetical protein
MDAIEISVTPPESLVKFEAPLFVGIESRQHASPTRNENASKLDDMINSMLPPRYDAICTMNVCVCVCAYVHGNG